MIIRHLDRLFIVAAIFLVQPVLAASHGNGHVYMSGSIVDAACAIATGDDDQSINIGTVPVSELIAEGQGPMIPFQIKLTNCALTSKRHNWNQFHITFEGPSRQGKYFLLQGHGRGEDVLIRDADGVLITPGEKTQGRPLQQGTTVLHYNLQVIKNGQPVQPGNLHTTIRYFMEYD